MASSNPFLALTRKGGRVAADLDATWAASVRIPGGTPVVWSSIDGRPVRGWGRWTCACCTFLGHAEATADIWFCQRNLMYVVVTAADSSAYAVYPSEGARLMPSNIVSDLYSDPENRLNSLVYRFHRQLTSHLMPPVGL